MTRLDTHEGQPESPSLFRGVAKHSFVYGIGFVLTRGASFLMLPIYTRYLTPADYGVLALIEMTLDFISIVGGGKLAAGIFRFYHKTDDPKVRKLIASTAFLLVGSLYFLLGVMVFLGAPFLSQLLFGSGQNTVLIRIAAVNLGMGALSIVPLAMAQVTESSVRYVSATVGRLLLVAALNTFCLVALGMGIMGVFVGGAIAHVLVGMLLATWLIRTSGSTFSKPWATQLLRYGTPLVAMQVATFLATFSDRYFLQAAADESVVGLYNLAYQFGFLLWAAGVGPIFNAWGPKRFHVAKQPDKDRLLSRGFLFLNLTMISTAVGIALYVTDVLRIMATAPFHPAAAVVPVILVAYIFQGWSDMLDIGILVTERTKLLAIVNWISAGVAVTGYAIFVPHYLEWGAAAVTVGAFFVRFGLTFTLSQRLWRVRYEWGPVMLLLVWAVAIVLASSLLPTMRILPSLTIRSGLVLAFFAGVWVLPILTREDKRAMLDTARSTLAGVVRRAPS